MRTGTRTVRAPPLMMSEPATICGRCSRTAARIFSLCRSQSRAPRENSLYQPLMRGRSGPSVFMVAPQLGWRHGRGLLLRQQRGDVTQSLLGAVFVIAIFLDQPLLDDGYFLTGFIVGSGGGGHQSQHIATLLEEILLDGLANARVAAEVKFLAGLEGHHGLADNLLAERLLARFGDLYLLFDRPQEAFVRSAVFAGHGIGDLSLIKRGLDLVQVLLQELLRLILKGCEQRAMHVLLDPAVIEFLAGGDQVIKPELLLLGVHARVAFDRVLERQQQLHTGEAVRIAAGNRVRQGIDHKPRTDPGEALIGRL